MQLVEDLTEHIYVILQKRIKWRPQLCTQFKFLDDSAAIHETAASWLELKKTLLEFDGVVFIILINYTVIVINLFKSEPIEYLVLYEKDILLLDSKSWWCPILFCLFLTFLLGILLFNLL